MEQKKIQQNGLTVKSCIGEVVYVASGKAYIWWHEYGSIVDPIKVNTLVYADGGSLPEQYKMKPVSKYLRVGDVVTFSTQINANVGLESIRAQDVHVHVNISVHDDSSTFSRAHLGLLDKKHQHRYKIKRVLEDFVLNKSTMFWDCCGVVVNLGESQGLIFCHASEEVPFNLLVPMDQRSWIVVGCIDNSLLGLGDYVVCDIESVKSNSKNLSWVARCVRKCDVPAMKVSPLIFSADLNPIILKAKLNVDEKVRSYQKPYWCQEREVVDGSVMWKMEGEIMDCNRVKVTTGHGEISVAKIAPFCWNPENVDLSATGTKVLICAVFEHTGTTGEWIVNCVQKLNKPTAMVLQPSIPSLESSEEQTVNIKCIPFSQSQNAKGIVESCVGEVIFVTKKKVNIWWYAFSQDSTKPNMLAYADMNSITKSTPDLTDYLELGDIITFSSRLVWERGVYHWIAEDVRVEAPMLENNERMKTSNVPSPDRSNIKQVIEKMRFSGSTVFWDCCGIVVYAKNIDLPVYRYPIFSILCLANENLPYNLHALVSTRKELSWIVGSNKILTCGDVVVCDIESTKTRGRNLVWHARNVRKCNNFNFTSDDDFRHLVLEVIFNTNLALNVVALSAKGHVDEKVQASQDPYWDQKAPALEGSVMWNVIGEIAKKKRINVTTSDGKIIAADLSPYCWNPDSIDLTATKAKVWICAEFNSATWLWIVYCIFQYSRPTRKCLEAAESTDPNRNRISCVSKTSLKSNKKQRIKKTRSSCAKRNKSGKPFIIESCVGEVIYVASNKANIWWYGLHWNSAQPNMLVSAKINSIHAEWKVPTCISLANYLNLGDIVTFSSELLTEGGQFRWVAQNMRVLAGDEKLNVRPPDELCPARSNIKSVIEELRLGRSTIFWDCCGVVVHAVKDGTYYIWCPANENVPCNLLARVTRDNSWIVGSDHLTCGEVVVCDIESIKVQSRNLTWQARCVRNSSNLFFTPDSDFQQLVYHAVLNLTFTLNAAALRAKMLVEEKVRSHQEPYWDESRKASNGSVMWNVTGEILPGKIVKTKNNHVLLISPNCWNPDMIDFNEFLFSEVLICAEYNVSIGMWVLNCVRKSSLMPRCSDKKPCAKKQYTIESCVGEVIHVESKSATIWWNTPTSRVDSTTSGVLVYATINSIDGQWKVPTHLLVNDYLKLGDVITFSSELSTANEVGLFHWEAAGIRPHVCTGCLNASGTCPCRSRVKLDVKDAIVRTGSIFWDCCGIVVHYNEDCGTIWCPGDGTAPCCLFIQVSKGKSWIVGRDDRLTCGEVVVCDIQSMTTKAGNLKWLSRCVRKSNTLHVSSSTDFRQFVMDDVLDKNIKLAMELHNAKMIIDELMQSFQEPFWGQGKVVMWNVEGETLDGKRIQTTTKNGETILAEISENCWNPDSIDLTTKSQRVAIYAEFRSFDGMWIVNIVRNSPPPVSSFSEMTALNVHLGNHFSSTGVVPNASLKHEKSMPLSPPATCTKPKVKITRKSQYNIEDCVGKVIHFAKRKAIIWWYASSIDSTRPNTLVYANKKNMQDKGSTFRSLNKYLNAGNVITFSCELATRGGTIHWRARDLRKLVNDEHLNAGLLHPLHQRRPSFEIVIRDFRCGNSIFWDCAGVVVDVRKCRGTIWCSENERFPYSVLVPVTEGMSWIVGNRQSCFDKALRCGDKVVCDIEMSKAVRTKNIIFLTRCVRKSSVICESTKKDFKQLLFDAALNRNIELNVMTHAVKTIVDERIQMSHPPYWDQLREISDGSVMWNVLGEISEANRIKVITKRGEVIVTSVSKSCWNPDGLDLSETSQKVVVCTEFNKITRIWLVHRVRKLPLSSEREQRFQLFPVEQCGFQPKKTDFKPSFVAESDSEFTGTCTLSQLPSNYALLEKTDRKVETKKEVTVTPRLKSVECQTISTGDIRLFNFISE